MVVSLKIRLTSITDSAGQEWLSKVVLEDWKQWQPTTEQRQQIYYTSVLYFSAGYGVTGVTKECRLTQTTDLKGRIEYLNIPSWRRKKTQVFLPTMNREICVYLLDKNPPLAAKKFRCSRKLLTNAKQKAFGQKSIRLETIQLIQAFYEENSSPLPYKKLVSNKTQKPRHIMRCTISELYSQYQKTHPDHKVSSGVFFAHRPRHVRTKSQAKYIGCLCECFENICLKLKVIN